jgi:hypothetical protein
MKGVNITQKDIKISKAHSPCKNVKDIKCSRANMTEQLFVLFLFIFRPRAYCFYHMLNDHQRHARPEANNNLLFLENLRQQISDIDFCLDDLNLRRLKL